MQTLFFANNRRALISAIRGEVIVMAAYTSMQWQGDAATSFRQEPNFWYLTGIEYPNWQLVLDGKQGKSWLIAPEVDSMHQLFDGSLSYSKAKEISGVDDVLSIKEGEALIESLSEKYETVYTLGPPPFAKYVDFTLNPAPELLPKRLKKIFRKVEDCQKDLARLRAIKQSEEIKTIKSATDITIEALENTKAKLSSSRYEYEVEAELSYFFRRHNATHAFEPIVANGINACTLHYVANSGKLRQDQLLLIDTGARLDYYSGDITRTFTPGDTTERQRAVYEAVKNALQQITGLIKPGTDLKQYLESSDTIMKDALISLGLMKSKKDAASFRQYFPHAISHGLGLDVHESLGGYKEFQPGMLLTVEPGIYIPEEEIGVRIEDDVLITENGHENLTAGLSTDL